MSTTMATTMANRSRTVNDDRQNGDINNANILVDYLLEEHN